MFDHTIQRIGFCCKRMESDQTLPKKTLHERQQQYSERSTTVAWLNRQEKSVAEQRLIDIVEHNMRSALRLVEWVGGLPKQQRMVRLGSNQIPMATEPTWRYMWKDSSTQQWLERGFAKIGESARKLDVRLDMHPGQFCVLASDRPDVVDSSIEEFEYHVDMIRWMGFGQQWQDFGCNVHISGRLGAQGIIDVLPRLSPEARNTITIENDEFGWGLDESLKLREHVALVLDIHHHWVREGEYIQPDDVRFQQVIDSWRGVRPLIHYSYSRDEHIPDIPNKHEELHDLDHLLEHGGKKTKLRAHSDYYPNAAANQWAASFWPYADIECESKMKNLAVDQLLSTLQ